ncbi:MAG TPA: hypothetical protein VL737_00915 [Candidatus Pristimantibacillus sp.]|jgi:hypothetical protein|nr:hypothetical protein [Candidatus Pristimantibacillus sp.]
MTKKWTRLERILQLESAWVTVYADKLLDDSGRELEYWHCDRADSAVVLAIQGDYFLLPAEQYRVGVEEVMLDFAGSRIGPDVEPSQAAMQVIQRELQIEASDIEKLEPLTDGPLAVDSSFSSQKLHGFVARIRPGAQISADVHKYKLDEAKRLRGDLRCVQCRLLLDEFLLK